MKWNGYEISQNWNAKKNVTQCSNNVFFLGGGGGCAFHGPYIYCVLFTNEILRVFFIAPSPTQLLEHLL